MPNSIVQLPRTLCAAMLSLAVTSNCAAQVYRWVDDEGRTQYSTTPQHSGQSAVQLPEIHKENIDNRIEFLKDNAPVICQAHGGIDCSAGPDKSDGSVICRDGFTDAVQSFAEYCTDAKLESKFLIEFPQEPKHKLHREVFRGLQKVDSRQPVALVAELRNTSGIEATNIEVHFKVPYVMPRKFQAIGPTRIPAYGVATYEFPFAQLPPQATPRHIAEAKIRVRCKNCGSVRSGRGK